LWIQRLDGRDLHVEYGNIRIRGVTASRLSVDESLP
jgi:hypothetical protein